VGTDPTTGQRIQQRILLNTASNTVAKILALGTGFLLTPFILGHIGPTDYGLWVLIGSVLGYGTLLDLGIAGALIKYIAQYVAEGRREDVGKLIATALRLYAGLGAVALTACLALAPLFPSWFAVPGEKRATAVQLVVVMGIGLAVSIPAVVPSAILRGLQRYDLGSLVSSLGTLLFVAAAVAVLLAGGGVVSLAGVSVATTILAQILALWLIRRTAPWMRLGWAGGERSLMRVLGSFSIWLFVEDMMWRVQTRTDEIVIGAFLPISVITPYSIARRLGEIPQLVTDQFMKVLMPVASELHAERDMARLRSLFVAGSRVTLAVVVPLAAVVILLARPLLTVWVGPEYADAAILVALLGLATLIDTSTWPAGAVLQGIGRYRAIALLSVVAAAANLGLSLLLVRPLGVLGVAVGTLVPTAVVRLALVFPYALRVMRVSAAEAVREIFLPALLPAIPAIAVLWVLGRVVPQARLLTLVLSALVGVGVYGAVYLAIGAGEPERDLARRLVRRLHLKRSGHA
jgi:O-antigen/teichoic acid export membrane protein